VDCGGLLPLWWTQLAASRWDRCSTSKAFPSPHSKLRPPHSGSKLPQSTARLANLPVLQPHYGPRCLLVPPQRRNECPFRISTAHRPRPQHHLQ